MLLAEKLQKNRHLPITLIYKGANCLGVKIANLLIDQGSFVIVVDEYTQKKVKGYIIKSFKGRTF